MTGPERCSIALTGLVFIGVVGVLALGGCAGREARSSEEETRVVPLDFLIHLPDGYEASDHDWPLVLFLHGAGERGSDLGKVKRHGPPRLAGEGKRFPFILVSPQCPEESWWTEELDGLRVLLDDMERKYRVDKDRIYVTGLSMGGFCTWALAAEQPNRFAAIAPICGGGDPKSAEAIAHLPTWVFHGAQDKTVPVERSQEMVDALRAAGAEPRFTVYPGAGHDSWTETYNNPEFYDWLLAQRR
jgi:predicted peptidase